MPESRLGASLTQRAWPRFRASTTQPKCTDEERSSFDDTLQMSPSLSLSTFFSLCLPLSFFISLFIFPLHYVFLSGMLSLSRGMKAGDLLGAKLTEGEEANGCGERGGRERKRERGRHCCRKNTSTLVHSRQRFTGPALLHYITQACRRSNGRNPNHRREVQERSSVCLWFLPPRSTAGFWGRSRHACPNIGDFGWRAENQRLSPLTKDSIMNCHT